MLVVSDVHVLITYSMIVESFFITLSVSSVLYFRYSQPNMVRPIKVSHEKTKRYFEKKTQFAHFFFLQLPLFVPIIFVVICALLIVVPCYVAPYEVLMGVIITVAGIPVYCMGVLWKDKPKKFQSAISKLQFVIHMHIPSFFFPRKFIPFILISTFFSATDEVTVFCQKFFVSAKEETD